MMGYAGDVAFDYVYDNQLTADGTYANEGVRTETDSDFLLYGFTANSYTSILILLQFRDSGGNFFSSNPLMLSNYAGRGSAPYLFPGKPRIFPPGSQIGIFIQELSGAPNTVEFTFRGEKRFVKPQPICGPDALTNRLLATGAR